MISKIKRRRKYVWQKYYNGKKKRRMKWKRPLKIWLKSKRRNQKKQNEK